MSQPRYLSSESSLRRPPSRHLKFKTCVLSNNQKCLDSIAVLISSSLIAVTYANGLPFYLRKIGIIDRPAYLQDISTFCASPINHLWLPSTCHYRKILSLFPLDWITINVGRIYTITALEQPLKVVKYGLIAIIILYSFYLQRKTLCLKTAVPHLSTAYPFLVASTISLLISITRYGLWLTFLGSMSSLWILLIPTCGWLTTPKRLQSVCDGLIILILSLVPLAVVEAMLGLPTPFGPSQDTLFRPSFPVPSRLSQVFIQPNTLGGFVVVSLAFCFVFSTRRKLLPCLTLSSFFLLFLARSATGILALTAFLFFHFQHRKFKQGTGYTFFISSKSLPLLLTLFFFVLLLPALLGRSDVWMSLIGRINILVNAFSSSGFFALLFGQGLSSSGALIQQVSAGSLPFAHLFQLSSSFPSLFQPSESTLQLLLIQQGVFGLTSFYGILLWCFLKQPCMRPLFLVIVLCSFTLKLGDIFPLNLILPLALNRSLQSSTVSC